MNSITLIGRLAKAPANHDSKGRDRSGKVSVGSKKKPYK